MTPEKVGRYEIKEQLGHGGMATVYRARDPRFNRDVAVKILPRELTLDPQFRTRFDREAQTIAALEHPAIVPVHDYGEEAGQPYLVMRLMQGGSLADRLKKGALPIRDVSKILDRIGSALDRAHEVGVIHRDLKPGNILFDQYGEAYLADFGIARLADSSTTLTGSGLVGTPAYMSPEQIEGKVLDGRTDIYALGIIVFEMLTGKRPYQADTPAMLLVKQMTEPMPRVLDVNPDLPPGCEDVITRATAKQATARYDKASQLAKTLSSALRYEGRPPAADITPVQPPPAVAPDSELAPTKPIEAKPDPAKRPLPRWLWGVAGLIVLGLLAIFMVPRLLDTLKNEGGEPGQTAVPGAITPENVQELVPQNQFGRGTIETAVLSPDSQLLAVGGSAGIWIYEAHTLALKRQLKGHGALVSVVAWSPDSQQLASGGWDQTVRIWQVESGELLGEIPHRDQVIALDWSPNGTILASATWGSQILLWEAATTNSLGELAGHHESVTHLAFSPDGTLLASASPDSARLWHVERQQEAALLTDSRGEWGSLRWSTDGARLLLTSLNASTVQVWDAAGSERFVLTGMEYGVYDAVWSPDNALLITTSGDGTVRLWGGLVGRQLRLLPTFNFDSVPVHLIWLADGNQLLMVLGNGVLMVVDAEGRQVAARTTAHTAVSGTVAFSPDSSRLATGHSDGSVRVWRAGSEEPTVLEGHVYGVTAVAWSPDGSALVSAGGDGAVRLWDAAQQAERLQWQHPDGEASTLAWSPIEPIVAIADFAGHLWLWDIEANHTIADWQIHNDAVSRLAWSPDGSELASSSWDGVVHVWQAQTGEALLSLTGHSDAVRDVAWSPDGSRLATVSHDFTVRVWDLAQGNVIWQEAHQELATSVAWVGDGRLLATGGWDLTIRIWNADSGDQLARLEDHVGPIISLDWAPDGTALVSGSEDGTAILWRLP
jgi:eukaryotic-like serine/threonine-protein kinase